MKTSALQIAYTSGRVSKKELALLIGEKILDNPKVYRIDREDLDSCLVREKVKTLTIYVGVKDK